MPDPLHLPLQSLQLVYPWSAFLLQFCQQSISSEYISSLIKILLSLRCVNFRSWILYFYSGTTVNCARSKSRDVSLSITSCDANLRPAREPPWTDMEESTVFVWRSLTSRSAWRSIRQDFFSREIRYPWRQRRGCLHLPIV